MEIIRHSINHKKITLNNNCGCDYCECSCDSDTVLPEDSNN